VVLLPHLCSCIADAKAFLAAHGVAYAEGSDSIEPEQPLSFDALQAAAATHALAAPTSDATTAAAVVHVKQEAAHGSAMDIDTTSSVLAVAAKQTVAQTPAEQLQSFFDAIAD
jgi:hypothetical protein